MSRYVSKTTTIAGAVSPVRSEQQRHHCADSATGQRQLCQTAASGQAGESTGKKRAAVTLSRVTGNACKLVLRMCHRNRNGGPGTFCFRGDLAVFIASREQGGPRLRAAFARQRRKQA